MSDIINYKFKFNRDNLKNIIDILKDLSKIDKMIKMKLDDEHVLFYSKHGKDNNIHAFKSFLLPIEDFIIPNDGEYITKDFIIINGINLTKNLELYLTNDVDINGRFQFKEKDRMINMMYINGNKLKFNFVTGDYRQIKDITKNEIETKMNPDLANFSFTVTKEEFKEIKKLSTLNKSETVSLRVENDVLEFFDTRWAKEITTLSNIDNETWHFENKYLKSINAADSVTIHMFDTFLLFKENNVALMIGFELYEIN